MDLTHQNDQEKLNVVPFFRSGDYFFDRGIIAYRKNHLQRAVKLFERAVKLTEKEPVFHVQLAAVLSELGEYERSNEILSTILQTDEEQTECYFFMANNYAYLGLFEKAESAAVQYLQRCPEDGFSDDAKDLLDLLKFERSELEDWEEFEEESDELIIDHERARNLLRSGDVKEAIPLLKSIVTNHPACWAAHNHLAEAYYRIGNDEAFAICDHVLTNDKGNLFAICNLAMFFSGKGDSINAASYISALNQVYPLDVDNHIKVAQVLCTVGEYKQTVRRLKVVDGYLLEYRPDLLFCLGVAYFQLDQVKKADALWRRAASLGHQQAKRYKQQLAEGILVKSAVSYQLWANH